MAFLCYLARRKLPKTLCNLNSIISSPIGLKTSIPHAAAGAKTNGGEKKPKKSGGDEKPKQPSKADSIDLRFEDSQASFKSKTNWELTRALIVYQICSYEKIVNNNMAIMKLMRKYLGRWLFVFFMKGTFYGHFVAGEDQYKIKPTLERLRQFGVRSILDYSVEEDLSHEEAEKREVAAATPEHGDKKEEVEPIKQFHVEKKFADRRVGASVRSYFYVDEENCDRNMDVTLKCLEAAADFDRDGTGMAALKLTALCRPEFLLILSEVIARTRKYFAEIVGGEGNILTRHVKQEELEKKFAAAKFTDKEAVSSFLKDISSDQEGIVDIFPWANILDKNKKLNRSFQVPDLKTGKIVSFVSHLSPKEEQQFANFVRRVNTVVKAAKDMNLHLMIDAEQTYFQPAINRIALEMMRKYNKEKPIVYNTYQCYLKETYGEVLTDMEQAKRQNFCFAAKLVRGAYMEQERERAKEMGYPDPVNESFEATSAMYHKTLDECLKRIKEFKDKGSEKRLIIMVASHNEDSIRYTLEHMKKLDISASDKVVKFGQLLGMCDYLTFPLGQAGYSVYKYVPYGPVEEVLPYLSRRARENRGILQKIKKEKRLLMRELTRRLANRQLVYTPKGNHKPS